MTYEVSRCISPYFTVVVSTMMIVRITKTQGFNLDKDSVASVTDDGFFLHEEAQRERERESIGAHERT